MADEKDNVVHINDIHDLKLSKIKPDELKNIYIDKNGHEYKLRYDIENKKIVIVRIIKSVLDGTYMKKKYDDNIAPDRKTEVLFKTKMGELSKKVLQEKYNVVFNGEAAPPAPGTNAEPKKPDAQTAEPITSTDGITIKNIDDALEVKEKVKTRLEMALKNIYESNIFNERLNYDDKAVLDEITRLIKNSIVEEFDNAKAKYEDLIKGFDDAKLKARPYDDETKTALNQLNPQERIIYLRDLVANEIMTTALEIVVKGFNDLEYKLSIIAENKINSRNFTERQKFNDAKITLNTCKNDVIKILNFFKQVLQQKKSPKGA
ncbi:MAG: hypothetical protein PHF84_01430 [bacterium]|nr:hypothetical protein [bacterium]